MKTEGVPPFQVFLQEHRTLVYRFLVASVGPVDADDAFQETFLAALRAYPGLRSGDNLRGWILTIATRKVIDAARARSRRAVPVADVGENAAGREDPHPWLDDDGLWGDVRGLPARQRVALVHRVLLDRPYPALAEAMGTSVEAARANVYQALKKLREARSREHERA